MTTLDGYPMTQRGKAFKALRVAHFSSVSGDTISDIVLFIGAPFLAIMVESYLDLPEKAALILLSLCLIAAIVGKPVAKGLIAVGFGLFISTIGTGEDFYPRLSGGVVALLGESFPIACVILGVLVIGEVFASLFAMRSEASRAGRLTRYEVTGDNTLPLREKRAFCDIFSHQPALARRSARFPELGRPLLQHLATVRQNAGTKHAILTAKSLEAVLHKVWLPQKRQILLYPVPI